MSHPRVVNVRARGAEWDVYVGRGPCPARGDAGRSQYGNPFDVRTYGDDAMRFYMAWLAGERDGPGVRAFQGAVLVEDVRRAARQGARLLVRAAALPWRGPRAPGRRREAGGDPRGHLFAPALGAGRPVRWAVSDDRLRQLERATAIDVAALDKLAAERVRAGLCPWCGSGASDPHRRRRPAIVLWDARIDGLTCCCTDCFVDSPHGPWESAGRVEGGHTIVCARCPLRSQQHERSYPAPGPCPRGEQGAPRPWSPMRPPRRPEAP